MPRQVDHEQRRRQIVGALLTILGRDGPEAATLRAVAREAGVSMGAVQHWFTTTDQMLRYALDHWLALRVHQGFRDRVLAHLGGPDAAAASEPGAVLRAIAAEYLPHDATSTADARIAQAFIGRALADTAVAEALRPAFAGLDDVLARTFAALDPTLDAPAEATRFAALLDGLRTRVLLGVLRADDAATIVGRHLAAVSGR